MASCFGKTNSVTAKITNGNVAINGVTYVPNSLLDVTAGTTTAPSTTIVANTLDLTGGAAIADPATSSLYSSGYSAGRSFIVQ